MNYMDELYGWIIWMNYMDELVWFGENQDNKVIFV